MSTQVLAKHGVTFNFAGRFLSKDQLLDAAKLYALCRQVDDIADETDDASLARSQLQAVHAAITNSAEVPYLNDNPRLVLSKRALFTFEHLLEGVIQDTYPVSVQTITELINYCYKVAGSVGLMMCDVLNVDDKRAYAHAVSLGIGMQLTNICRDVVVDANNQRVYLPKELIGDVSCEQVTNPDDTLKLVLQEAVSELLEIADHHYRYAYEGLVFLPFRARVAILFAGQAYREIGNKLKHIRHLDLWGSRVTTSRFEKILVAFPSLIKFGVSKGFYHYQPKKQPSVLMRCISHYWREL
jgi:phytoene synthase